MMSFRNEQHLRVPRTSILVLGHWTLGHELWIKIDKVLKILVVSMRWRKAFVCIRKSDLRFFFKN